LPMGGIKESAEGSFFAAVHRTTRDVVNNSD